jgi:hypothetical protein
LEEVLIICPDVGTKVLVRSFGGLEDGGRSESSRSAPSHLHSAKIMCTHGNVTHGDFRGASGTVRPQPATLNALRAPRWGRVARQFLDEIFSLIQRNSQDEVLGVFPIKNLVINNFMKKEKHFVCNNFLF